MDGEKRLKSNGNNILVVEDNDLIAKLIVDSLDKCGTVKLVRNGQDALNIVTSNHFDVIISDIQMPIMDGIEFYKAAVKIDSDMKNRFLFYTASDIQEHRMFFTENQVPFLHKLTDRIDDLENAIQGILNKKS